MKYAKLLTTCLLVMTIPAAAEIDPTPVDPEAKKINEETARIVAETARITAQQAQETAKNNLANAQNLALQEAARQKALAEAAKASSDAQKAAADSEKAAITASNPTFTSTALDGGITADAASGYFVQVLAYDALRSLTDKIVDQLHADKSLPAGSKVYLASTGDQLQSTGLRLLIAGKLNAYKYAFAQLNQANTENAGEPTFQKESLAALSTLPSLIGVAADVASFFRQNRTITGKTVTVSAHVMAQAVSGAWMRQSKTNENPLPAVEFIAPAAIIRIPDAHRAKTLLGLLDDLELEFIKLTGVRDLATKQLEKNKLVLADRKTTLADLKIKAGDKPTADQKAEIETATAKVATLESHIGLSSDYLSKMTAVLSGYRSFADTLLTVASGDSQSPLAKVFYNDVLDSDPSQALFVLQVEVLSIGGEMETRKWLWGSGKIYHRAGAVCQYTLFERSGKIVASGLVAADRQLKEGKSSHNYLK